MTAPVAQIAAADPAVDAMAAPLRVIARYGVEVDLLQLDGSLLRARLRRRMDDVVCGDQVYLEPEHPVIVRRAERTNQLVRRDGFDRIKTIAANIERAWIVVAPAPETPRLLIDRFLVGILNLPAQAGIVVNKSDLANPRQSPPLAPLLDSYQRLGLTILAVSAHTGAGMDELRKAARGGSNILVGPSGTGKSSLIQALLPRETLRVGELGETGEGRHTTTTARWYETGDGAAWIDSPGVRDFSPELESAEGLARGFPDIAAIAEQCRFRNCSHRSEPGCAVREAGDKGKLPADRLEAWLELFLAIRETITPRRSTVSAPRNRPWDPDAQ